MAQFALAQGSLEAAVAEAAQVTAALQREALARAELIALGREAIGELPYFEDLGLSSDESFLLSLGRRGAARNAPQPCAEALRSLPPGAPWRLRWRPSR